MTYTTHGYMTPADLADHRKLYDLDHEEDPVSDDRKNLDAALALIKAAYPKAFSVDFETSDQNDGYGFVLRSIRMRQEVFIGVPGVQGGEEVFAEQMDVDLQDQIGVLLSDIDWDGVMEEDKHGSATVEIA